MNAADVLAEALDPDGLMNPDGDYDPLVAALLAHGEQGVAILPDGTLWALETTTLERITVTPELRLLVPISAEATDDPKTVPMPPTSEVHGTWMGGGLEITYPSAEAGDTP
jgi:hypothetical protein